MTTTHESQPGANPTKPSAGRVNWRRPEFVLTALAVLGFVTVPIRIGTVWGGLPAHPLFVHVPVMLIPLSVFGALVCVWRPAWLTRYGTLLCGTSIVAMSSIFLAMQAGAALKSVSGLKGIALHIINEHEQTAHVLAVTYVVFTAVLILTFAAHQIRGLAGPTGLTVVDRLLGSDGAWRVLRILLVVLALGCVALVVRVGDLGAQSVWLH